jgi:hypothetical protein
MRMKLRLVGLLCVLEAGVYAQGNPVAAQFDRLMGQPKELVNDLVSFPWNAQSPDALPGFRRVPHGQPRYDGPVYVLTSPPHRQSVKDFGVLEYDA